MALPATDSFIVGTSGELSAYNASWTSITGTLYVSESSDSCIPWTPGAKAVYRWNADTFADDQYAEATVGVMNATVYNCIGPAVRVSNSAATCYAATWDGAAFMDGGAELNSGILWKIVAGTATRLATFTNPAINQVVRLEATGGATTSLKVYFDGVQQGSTYSDSSSPITSGSAGIAGAGQVATTSMLDWTAGNLASGPTITDVNTDEALSPGETATITGTGFGATQGTGGVKLTQEAGALESALTGITWGGDTSITGTVALGGLSYGATTSLVVTDNAAATGSIAVTFVPATGYSYVTLSGYPGTGYVIGEDASPAVVDGDQVEYESTASSGATVTVNADGTFVLSTTDPASFSYRVRDNTDNTWSSWGTIRVNMPNQGGAGINLGIRIGV